MNFEQYLQLFTQEKIDIEYIRKDIYEKTFLKEVNGRIESKGAYLGTQKKSFEPSLYLLERISKVSKNKVFVNKESEWLFLCGRDVFEKNILKNDATKHIFLVQNENDENLGLGMFTRGMVKNLMDRGDFLRRE